MDNMQPEQSPHLSEYYYVLRKHIWTVVASLVIIVTLTMLYTFLIKPIYRATATLAIEKERGRSPLTGDAIDYESYLNQSITLNTHLKLITSRPIMKKVASELKLDQVNQETDLEVSPWRKLLNQFRKNIRLLLGREERFISTEERLEALADTLRNKTDIELIRDTILLKINIEDQDPVLARDIANAIAKTYIEFNISNRLEYSQNTLTWMSDQLYEVKKRLEDSEAEFLEYKQNEKIFSVEGRQKVIDQKIQEFNDAYLEARNSRLSLDAKLSELKNRLATKGDIMQARSLLSNTLIDNLYGQLLEMGWSSPGLTRSTRENTPRWYRSRRRSTIPRPS